MSDDHQENATANIAIDATPFTRADTGPRKKKLALKPVPIAIGVVFLVLFLSALFMFTAKAVRFDVSPLPEQLEITEGFFTYKLGERYLMLPGKYAIAAQLTGYHDLNESIIIGDDPDQDFTFDMGFLTLPKRELRSNGTQPYAT